MTETSLIRLGILGMSEGNGHPYSWAAIVNGYDRRAMANCPFPAIPAYLAEHRFPEDFLSAFARVTHVWTQDNASSCAIAAATLIDNVVRDPEDMIDAVDAVLLARDDAENHRRLASPFLAAGLPVFVDKPLAIRGSDAEALLSLQRYEGQIFSCTSLRFARELRVTQEERRRIGRIRLIEGTTPKYWKTYAVHVLEPIVAAFGDEWGLPFSTQWRRLDCIGNLRRLTFALDSEVLVSVTSTGQTVSPIGFRVYGDQGWQEHVFHDSFGAFRACLAAFLGSMRQSSLAIPRAETRQVVACIEWGLAPADETK
jgi:hypothetical protein